MRLLAIEQEPRVQALIRHHASCRWPAVEVIAYQPVERGAIPAEYLAQGFDAVLLCQSWPGGDGQEGLRGLAHRAGFAPVIFMPDRDDAPVKVVALGVGAFAVLSKERVVHAALLDAIDRASHR